MTGAPRQKIRDVRFQSPCSILLRQHFLWTASNMDCVRGLFSPSAKGLRCSVSTGLPNHRLS